jgi:NTE family protein
MALNSNTRHTKLGLALSGGGMRAVVFHLGFLRRLAADNLFEQTTHLSTVSGGSLATAAIFAKAGMRWPTSIEYLRDVYPALRGLFTTTDLLSLRTIGWKGLFRFNLKIVHKRAAILADQLAERWHVNGHLHELPTTPIWWINSTCLETGKNWRFSKEEMGDWQFGRHYSPPFSLAEAVAASAAVPYAIGALAFNLPAHGWYQTDPATRQPLARRQPPASTVRLWDGGAYENLGLESLYKPGRPLIGCDFLICSDASGPPCSSSRSTIRNLLRGRLSSPRLFDIASDQIRALRCRMLVRDIESKTIRGALVRMGNSTRDIDIKSGRPTSRNYNQYQKDQDTTSALLYPTDLKALPDDLFDLIARHGFEITDAILTTHTPVEFPESHTWSAA